MRIPSVKPAPLTCYCFYRSGASMITPAEILSIENSQTATLGDRSVPRKDATACCSLPIAPIPVVKWFAKFWQTMRTAADFFGIWISTVAGLAPFTWSNGKNQVVSALFYVICN